MKRIPHLLLALILAFSTFALAADVGLLLRDNCTTISGPVAGQAFCFDRTANVLKRWSGTAWELISVGGMQLPSSTLAGLPPAGTAGRLARVTDDDQGAYMDDGAAWQQIAPLEVSGLATWDIDGLRIKGVGPHAIGGATSAGVGLSLLGFTGPSNVDTFGVQLTAPITVGAPTNAATLKILGAPTGATNNYALWNGGVTRLDVRLSFFNPASGVERAFLERNAFDEGLRIDSDAAIEFQTNNILTMRLTTDGILALGTTVTTGALPGDLVSTKGWTTEAAGAAHPTATANAVTIYIREDIDVGAGTATADCAIRARKSDGTEVNIVTLVTDGGCP